MGRRINTGFFIIFLFIAFVSTYAWPQDGSLTFVTTSDLQGQMDPAETEHGFLGGFSKIAWIIKQERLKSPGRVVSVATGDDLMGVYFLNFKGKAIYSVMSTMGIDAATLGNHEFDQGPEVLSCAMGYARFPFVETNMYPTPGSPLRRFRPYLILERGGLLIGFIGLMTPDLPRISKVQGSVNVVSPFSVARKWARFLKKGRRVDLVVALTHLGLPLDRELAQEVPEIDLICGAHSHDLLEEPIVVEHGNGRKTLIVQTGARGFYVGVLNLVVKGGSISSYSWKLVKVDGSIPRDPDVEGLIFSYRDKLPPDRVVFITTTPIDLRKEALRLRESPFGDLVGDILRDRFGVDAVILNGGSLRGDRVIPAGPVTTRDLDSIFPFGNNVVVLKVKGKVLKEALERGFSALPSASGRFPQISGIRVLVDASCRAQELLIENGKAVGILKPGRRVVRLEVLSGGHYVPVDPDRVYSIATNRYMADGGDGYIMLRDSAVSKMDSYVTVKSVVQNALSGKTVSMPDPDGRISFVSSSDKGNVDGEDGVNFFDALELSRMLLGLRNLQYTADMNCDSSVDIVDALIISMHSLMGASLTKACAAVNSRPGG